MFFMQRMLAGRLCMKLDTVQCALSSLDARAGVFEYRVDQSIQYVPLWHQEWLSWTQITS